MTLPKILIVEDDVTLQRQMGLALERFATVLSAQTQESALEAFNQNPDVKVIFMDGYVPMSKIPYEKPTLPLIKTIREAGYTGPMIAGSTSFTMQCMLVEAGCSHEYGKAEAVKLIKDWLEDPAKMAEAWAQSGKMVLGRFASPAKAETAPNPG